MVTYGNSCSGGRPNQDMHEKLHVNLLQLELAARKRVWHVKDHQVPKFKLALQVPHRNFFLRKILIS